MKDETQMGHGAIKINPVRRWVNKKLFRKKFKNTGKGIPFDWNVGYDVRNKIGQIAIKNQGLNDSCGGESGSYFLEIQRRLQGINEGAISAKSIYSPIAYPGGGTEIPDLENQICAKGGNLEKDVPSYDIYGNPLSETMMQDKSWITPTTLQDALKRAGYTPYDVGTDIDTVAAVIQDWGAAIMEIHGQNGHTPDWRSATPQPPSLDNPNPIFAHFMCCIGAKMINGTKYIIALQSEGEDWGSKGLQAFDENYFNSGYIKDVFTCCYDTRLVPSSTNFSHFAWLLRWFRLSWGLTVGRI